MTFGVAIVVYLRLWSYGANPAPAWLQTAFAIAWATFLLTALATTALYLHQRLSSGSSRLAAPVEVGRRLLIGVCAPVGLLMLLLTLIVEGARGGGEHAGFAAMYIVWISFIAVPVILLANCWLLFGARRAAWRLFVLGSIMPMAYGALATIAVHASRGVSEVAMGVLLPLAWILGAVENTPQAATASALAVLAALAVLFTIAAARYRIE
jgi:hypothetical protein